MKKCRNRKRAVAWPPNYPFFQTSSAGSSLLAVLAVVIVVGVLAVMAIAFTFGKVVYPGNIGVRQITLGPHQGFSEDALMPGYHWNIPAYSKIHMVPQEIQIMNMHRDTNLYPESPGSLEIQTTDGSSVDVDIAVFYKYFKEAEPFSKGNPGKGGPSDLLKHVGNPADRIDHIQTVVINELKKSLGSLSTSEFYRGASEEQYDLLREKRISEAVKVMNARLNEVGIDILSVLLRRYTYTEARIDDEIFEKNLQDQEERLNRAKSLLAAAQAELEQVEAEWDAKIRTLKVEHESRSSVILSEGDLYETQKKADGDLELATAKAKVEELRASVLTASAGSDIYVAKELAPLLGSLKGGVITEIDPYNLPEWMKRLGLKGSVR